MIAPWESRWRHQACHGPVAILAGVAAAGALVSAVGSISSGIAQNKAAEYDQQVDRNNAIQAAQASDAQGEARDDKTRSQIGQQMAAYAASGVDVNTGSPTDVMADTASKGRLDAMTLRYGGQIAATRDVEAGQLAAMQGQAAEQSGFFSAGGSLLTNAANIGHSYGIGGA